MLEDFDISQKETLTWRFSFAKVRKLCFFCSCKQTCETSISPRCMRRIRLDGFHVRQSAEVRNNCLLRLKYGYFSYKNAWIRYRRPLFMPRSRVRHVLLWMRALYLTCFGLLKRNTPPTATITLGIARTIFNITLIGFV